MKEKNVVKLDMYICMCIYPVCIIDCCKEIISVWLIMVKFHKEMHMCI